VSHQIPLDPSARADSHSADADASEKDGTLHVAPDLAYQRLLIVNVCFCGGASGGDRGWVLVDAGVTGSATTIAQAAARRFGEKSRPAAILLTHGHFDHVGALKKLADHWDTPIYAHSLEHPYLNGESPYPAPDPTVGGGLMATLSRFYPVGPIDVSDRLRSLPEDGSVPAMPGWRWLHTPGHAPGHVSFWNETSRTLIAGDAFITTNQESAYDVVMQRTELHGPPMYFTPDWHASKKSVELLASLNPEIVITGHGRAMRGPRMREALHTLAERFDEIAVPEHGRYVDTVQSRSNR
jgi:glyoxylase-like metal-dependent hydrolase (beta-lactamase superfamily II)